MIKISPDVVRARTDYHGTLRTKEHLKLLIVVQRFNAA